MAMDKDDWGSGFGCDPDYQFKKIIALEQKCARLEAALSHAKEIIDSGMRGANMLAEVERLERGDV